MTQQEFESRIGKEVDSERYRWIEEIYMMSGNLNKDEFCEDYMKHRSSKILTELAAHCQSLLERNERSQKANKRIGRLLVEKANRYNDLDLRAQACEILGEAEYILLTIEMGYTLTDADLTFIKSVLTN